MRSAVGRIKQKLFLWCPSDSLFSLIHGLLHSQLLPRFDSGKKQELFLEGKARTRRRGGKKDAGLNPLSARVLCTPLLGRRAGGPAQTPANHSSFGAATRLGCRVVPRVLRMLQTPWSGQQKIKCNNTIQEVPGKERGTHRSVQGKGRGLERETKSQVVENQQEPAGTGPAEEPGRVSLWENAAAKTQHSQKIK